MASPHNGLRGAAHSRSDQLSRVTCQPLAPIQASRDDAGRHRNMALRSSINRATRILLSVALLVGGPAESAFAATLAQAAGQERIVWIPRAGTPNGMFTRA